MGNIQGGLAGLDPESLDGPGHVVKLDLPCEPADILNRIGGGKDALLDKDKQDKSNQEDAQSPAYLINYVEIVWILV